jgi:hypothetical protein
MQATARSADDELRLERLDDRSGRRPWSGLIAITAVRRRRTRRRAEYAQVGSESGRRRIEVVAINDANPGPDGRTIERK